MKYDLTSAQSVYIPLQEADELTTSFGSWSPFLGFFFNARFGFDIDIFGYEVLGFEDFIGGNILQYDNFNPNVDDDTPIPILFSNTAIFENRDFNYGYNGSLILGKTEGEVGSRIFKLEYFNTGFFQELNTTYESTMYTNQQIWVYEDSECIEVRFGPSNITDFDLILDGASGPGSSLILASRNNTTADPSIVEYAIAVSGDPNNPTEFEAENEAFEIPALDGYPADGMVYTFCPEGVEPPVSSRNVIQDKQWSIYPNPVENTLNINFKDIGKGEYSILTIEGKLILSGQISTLETENINMKSLPQGSYLIRLTTQEGVGVKRFFKVQ